MISVFLISFVSLEDCQSCPLGPDVCNSSANPPVGSELCASPPPPPVWDASEPTWKDSVPRILCDLL